MARRLRLSLSRIQATVTALGWAVLALGALAWVGAVWVGWAELRSVFLMAVVLVALAVLFTIGRLDLSSSVVVKPTRVVVGSRALVEVRVRNERSRSVRGLHVEFPVGNQLGSFSESKLKGGEEIDQQFVVPTHRRAILDVGPVTTAQGDPLGLVRRERRWSGVEQIFVHPLTVNLEAMSAGLVRDMEGQATSQLSPSDVAFHTLRDYVAGDDPRHIHWKSSAKHTTLQVRQYVDTRRSHVAVVLSTNPAEYVDAEEFELAVSCAASIASQALLEEQTLSIFAGGEQLPALRIKDALDHYSGVEQTSGAGGAVECMKVVRSMAKDASLVAFCTGSTHSASEIQAATRYLPISARAVVFQADLANEARLQRSGTSTFVTVPTLSALAAGVASVSMS